MIYPNWFVCVMGMGTVFAGLIILIFAVKIMGLVFGRGKAQEEEEAAAEVMKWSSEEIRRQNMILEKSDEVIFVRQHYCQGIYMIRNRALADGAQVCIAYCNRPKGGTAWTVRYAKQNGLRTYNLAGGEGK